MPNVGNMLLPPKTDTSARDVLIDGSLCSLLRKWKKQCAEYELSCGDNFTIVDEKPDHTLSYYSKGLATPETNRRCMICIYKNGRPVSRATLTHLLANNGLNAHSFRHTHATMLAEDGAPLRGIAGRLGHKRLDVTNDIYTHNTQKMQEDVVEIFAKKMQTK
jgi:integrase